MIGGTVISQGSFLPSLVFPVPARRKSLYKFTGRLRERFPTPTYNTLYQDKKDNDEDHLCDGEGGLLL